jgi:hypothetical protein
MIWKIVHQITSALDSSRVDANRIELERRTAHSVRNRSAIPKALSWLAYAAFWLLSWATR